MANLGYLLSEVKALPADQRPTMTRIVTDLCKHRFGHSTQMAPDPLENVQGAFLTATTPAVANTEFSISHGFGRTPYGAMPWLPLDVVGSRTVPLTVTRAADDKRIYLSSSVESAPFTLVVEG